MLANRLMPATRVEPTISLARASENFSVAQQAWHVHKCKQTCANKKKNQFKLVRRATCAQTIVEQRACATSKINASLVLSLPWMSVFLPAKTCKKANNAPLVIKSKKASASKNSFLAAVKFVHKFKHVIANSSLKILSLSVHCNQTHMYLVGR